MSAGKMSRMKTRTWPMFGMRRGGGGAGTNSKGGEGGGVRSMGCQR